MSSTTTISSNITVHALPGDAKIARDRHPLFATAIERAMTSREPAPPWRPTRVSTPSPRRTGLLVREWHGRVYSVVVREQGFELDGGSYGSLTRIAREITGAKWSGPRFFGLADRRGAGRQDVSGGEPALDIDAGDLPTMVMDHGLVGDDSCQSTDDGDLRRARARAGGDRDD